MGRSHGASPPVKRFTSKGTLHFTDQTQEAKRESPLSLLVGLGKVPESHLLNSKMEMIASAIRLLGGSSTLGNTVVRPCSSVASTCQEHVTQAPHSKPWSCPIPKACCPLMAFLHLLSYVRIAASLTFLFLPPPPPNTGTFSSPSLTQSHVKLDEALESRPLKEEQES